MKLYMSALLATLALVFLAPTQVAAETTDLVAGRNITIGTVSVNADGGDVVVAYQITEPGWCIGLTHLYLGDTPPVKGAPGQFPYQADAGCAQSFEYRVPLTASFLYVAAHAEVERTDGGKGETAWGTGTDRLRGGWGTYFQVIFSVPE